MKYLFILAPALLCLSGCNLNDAINSPGSVANATVLDEQVGIGTEAAYTTASTLGTALAQAGVIDKAKFKTLDQKAYDALLAVRSAYSAGNASSYMAASAQVYATVAQIKSLVK